MQGNLFHRVPRRGFLRQMGVSLAVAAGWEPWEARAAAEAAEGQKTISLFHTTDLHGHILPTKTYAGETDLGGLARCATRIREWRTAQPHSLLLDLGDVYQGTPESRQTEGRMMIGLFNKLQYDAWVIGNHEFDWGFGPLVKNVQDSAMPVLASNAKLDGKWTNQLEATHPLSKVAPFLIKEVDGFRIGIIGSVTPGLPAWLPSALTAGFIAADPLKSVTFAIRKLQAAKVDAIVLACHFGLKRLLGGKPAPDDFANRVNEVTAACREIDVVIAGHTHQDIGQVEVNGIPYSQAGYYGIFAGRVDLTFDLATRKLLRKEVSTHRMDSGVAADPMVMAHCQPELAASSKRMAVEIGNFTAPLPCKAPPGVPPASLLLITRSIRHALETRGESIDGVLHGLFLNDADLPAGVQTIGKMWEVIPFENRILTASFTLEELRLILEETQMGRFSTHHLDGFRAVFQETDGRQVLKDLIAPPNSNANAKPEQAERRFRIALNAYDAQSGGQRFPRLRELCNQPAALPKLHAVESRDALIEFLTARKQIGPGDLLPV